MTTQPAYELNDKITYKGIPGIITKVYKYNEEELLEALEFLNIDWIQSHPFSYTITYDVPQSFESILLKRRYPNDDPSTWRRTRLHDGFDFIDFDDVKIIQ